MRNFLKNIIKWLTIGKSDVLITKGGDRWKKVICIKENQLEIKAKQTFEFLDN